MKHPSRSHFQPRLEVLEDRCTPSTMSSFPQAIVPPSVAPSQGALITPASSSADHHVPFKEHLTLTSKSSDGTQFYFEGNATHLGHVTAVLSAPSQVNGPWSFVKTAANGDQLFGYGTPDDPYHPFTTGTLTFTGGTGKYEGVTGKTSYIISTNPQTGAVTADITGWISYAPGSNHNGPLVSSSAHSNDTRVVPFKITGGGPAPEGMPLVPGTSVPHSATGNATFLGHYTTKDGTFTLESLHIDPTTGAVTGTFSGSIVFVAANGDQLAFNYGVGNTGTFTAQLSPDGTTVTNVTFDAIFTVDPANCTGRFANVVGGSFEMIAHADSVSLIPGSAYTAPFDYTWSGQGTLEFSNGR